MSSSPFPSPDNDTVRILLSTDNHLGYNERDPVRGLDSFAAMEEVLFLAKQHECDMVLIAGDLFHENKPSRRTLYKTMDIFRRYCMGPNPVALQLVSDPTTTLSSNTTVNYEDAFYSVDLPVFSIHGNHDDPTRDGTASTTTGGGDLLAALDVLAISNLVNYFGKQTEVNQVEVAPLLLKKGTTKLALYGMGNLRDERLNRMWQGNHVRFLRPNDDDDHHQANSEEEEAWFHMFALHQNRDLGRGTKNCVHETMIPEWMDLVVWGHEHECCIDFQESVAGTFRITQPGSSVATSLTAGEAVRKQIGLLDVKGHQFRLHTIPLTQVRPFCMGQVSLPEQDWDPEDPNLDQAIRELLEEEVELRIHQAREQREELLQDALQKGNSLPDHNSLRYQLVRPEEVLVRIRVDHTGFTTLNNQRFGARFVGQVANPSDLLLFHRKKATPGASSHGNSKKAALNTPIAPAELEELNVEDLVKDDLEGTDRKLEILQEKRLCLALGDFVTKQENQAVGQAMSDMLEKQQNQLIHRQANDSDSEDNDDEDIAGSKQDSSKQLEPDDDESMEVDSDQPKKKKATAARKRKVAKESDDDNEEEPTKGRRKAATSTRKTARSQTTTSRARRPTKSRVTYKEDSDDDDVEVLSSDFDDDVKPRKKRTNRSTSLDDSSIEEVMPTKRKASVRSSSSTSKPPRRTRQTKLSFGSTTSNSVKPRTKKKRRNADDSDDFGDDGNGSADDDWGTSIA